MIERGAICAHSVGAVKLYKNCTKRVNIRKSAYLQRARICDDLRDTYTTAYILTHSPIQGTCECERGMYKNCTEWHIVSNINNLCDIVNVQEVRITYFSVQKLINQLML